MPHRPYLRGQPECKVGYATERAIDSFCSWGQVRQFGRDRNAGHDWEEILITRPVAQGRQPRRCEAPCKYWQRASLCDLRHAVTWRNYVITVTVLLLLCHEMKNIQVGYASSTHAETTESVFGWSSHIQLVEPLNRSQFSSAVLGISESIWTLRHRRRWDHQHLHNVRADRSTI